MRISSIDIGTNTILLLIAEMDADSIVRVVARRTGHSPAWKRESTNNRVINQETFRRAADFLRSYSETSGEVPIGKNRCCREQVHFATHRTKKNFANSSFRHVGIAIEILSGEEEAEWTCRGAVVGIDTAAERFTVLDIGGGSTEIVSGVRDQILNE